MSDTRATHRSVLFFLAVNFGETLALAVAAWVTGSVALVAQSAANGAELAAALRERLPSKFRWDAPGPR